MQILSECQKIANADQMVSNTKFIEVCFTVNLN